MKTVKTPHWYKSIAGNCPVCGKGSLYRVRIYGEKPESSEDRYFFETVYDYCMEDKH